MPWFADISYWLNAHKQIGDLPPGYDSEDGFIQFHADHHVGYYLYGGSPFAVLTDGVEVEHRAVDGDTHVTWRAPVGEMTGVQHYLPETFSTAWTVWPCRSPEDLRVVRYIADSRRFERGPESGSAWQTSPESAACRWCCRCARRCRRCWRNGRAAASVVSAG